MGEIEQSFTTKDARLSAWFAANRARLISLSRIIGILRSTSDPDQAPDKAAQYLLNQAKALVISKHPTSTAWFDQNIKLLRLVAVKLTQAIRRPPDKRAGQEDRISLARAEAILFPEEAPAPSDASLIEIAGKPDRIRAYLDELGSGNNDQDPIVDRLAALSLAQLKQSLGDLLADTRKDQNAKISAAADVINRELEGSGEKGNPFRIHDLESNPNQESILNSISALAADGFSPVAGFVSLVREFRPALSDRVDDAILRIGTLSQSWKSASIRGRTVSSNDPDPLLFNALLGQAVAKQIRIVDAPLLASRDTASVDLNSVSSRTRANLAAISLLTRGEPFLARDRRIIAGYSGWGGLSINAIRGKVPPEWLPDDRALIHEYYTPERVAAAIARIVQPRLADLKDSEGRIRALEPSAGIGRMIRAHQGPGFENVDWVACEYSRVSASLLRAVLPGIMVFNEPFEGFVVDHSDQVGGFQLVVSNPPYGERGPAALIDKDIGYREKAAWLYQMRRSLQFLQPGGIGVFLIPSGFMTGKGKRSREARRKILRTAHLMAAFRLPSETEDGTPLFPGALLVTDVVLLRARGGELSEVSAEDADILEGNYFRAFPQHILGREVGRTGDDSDQSRKPRFGYQVRGTFSGIPDFEERPICRECVVEAKKPAPRPVERKPELDAATEEALALAGRISRFYSDVARGDLDSIGRAQAAHGELVQAVEAWHSQEASEISRVAGLARRNPGLAPLLSAYSRGRLAESLSRAPGYEERYQGDVQDIAAIAAFRYSSGFDTSLGALTSFQESLGGVKDAHQVKAELLGSGFAFDEEQAIPESAYYSGALWDKYDRAVARAELGDEVSAIQASKLLEKIRPAHFAELEVEPRLGWMPLKVLSGYLRYWTEERYRDSTKYEITRDETGFITVSELAYDSLPSRVPQYVIDFLGYLNHDLVYFKPERAKGESQDKARENRAAEYRETFIDWLEGNASYQTIVANAFNRIYRGWIPPEFPKEPVLLARWNKDRPLFGYQWSAIRRLNSNHGGGLFFDVGLGKTRTILAAIALARQQGWARRPVICVPNSVTYNWLAEIERVLPDFRVVIIGSKRKPISRGPRKGEIDSDTDTPVERAQKWEKFKAGLYDVAIVTYSSLPRTQIRPETLSEIVNAVPAIRRQIGLESRSVQARIAQLEKKSLRTREQESELADLRTRYGKLSISERRAAISKEKAEAFVAAYADLPAGQEFDPGIYWDDLGVDLIALDESHIAKNLWTVGPREGGALKFLGAPQAASGIAFQVFFRCAVVRRNSGGRGIHLADATPAKNSPLEFLSLLSLVDDQLWDRLGLTDPEQYVTQYLKIEKRLVTDTDLSVVEAPCVVGFKNLDQLREVLFRYGEFRTAAEVGLKIPKPEVYQVEVQMDEAQEEKYASYISQYTSAISKAGVDEAEAAKALGLLARMSLVAVHSKLDEPPAGGWSLKNFTEVGDYSSPKLERIASLVSAKRNCGHLVFLENTVTHYWLKEILVKAGIPRSRIAILNGEVTPTPLSRQRVAEDFTSDQPKYDVVIANRVAYEGLNLQVRTCAIYHGDLPWEPATLQQRNGRGLRQGNKYDVIEIYYVLSARSMDGARFELIRGKREWMAELVESAASESNNPAAQTNMSPEEWLIFLSRDKEQTRELIEARKAAIKEQADARARKLAWAHVRSIAIRQRDLRNADLAMRTRLMEEIYKIADELESLDGDVWQWKFIIPLITKRAVISFAPKEEGAIWQGARYSLFFLGEVSGRGEFGKVVYEPRLAIGHRKYGEVKWTELISEEAEAIFSQTNPESWQTPWDSGMADELGDSIREFLDSIRREGVWNYRQARLDLATNEFRQFIADNYLADIIHSIRASEYAYQSRLPIIVDGALVDDINLASPENVLPFTGIGYEQFIRAAVTSTLKWTDLNSIAEWWWGKGIPRNLLTLADKKQAA